MILQGGGVRTPCPPSGYVHVLAQADQGLLSGFCGGTYLFFLCDMGSYGHYNGKIIMLPSYASE